MAGTTEEKDKDLGQQMEADPWAAAFAALDRQNKEAAEAASGDDDAPDVPDADGADAGEGAAAPEGGDGDVAEGEPGGPGDLGGADGGEDDNADWFGIDVSQEYIDNYRKQIEEEVEERVLRDVAKAYIDRGVRNTNGVLGANINDPDICKRDSDGVPRFYNPETGREFTGPNPRKEAQEWVEAYNKELAEAFNKTCADYTDRLMEKERGKIAILEFAPKYKALDPIRRDMLDSIVEDYEILDDNGDIVGYSCDLDKALAAVNRQVKMIQSRYAGTSDAKPEPTGPVLDTPNTSPQQGGGTKPPEFKSVAEAMEWQQDQLLAKMRRNNG